MAKVKDTMATPVHAKPAETETAPVLSKKTVALVEGVRSQFVTYASTVGAMLSNRDELAPKFMRAFGAWQADTAGTFVQFVRFLEPALPEDSKAYKAHPVYTAADYLRRKVAQSERAKQAKASGRSEQAATAPATPLDAIARILSALLPNITDKVRLWSMLGAELHWTERQISRVQHMATKMPALPLKASKGADIRIMAPLKGMTGGAQATGS